MTIPKTPKRTSNPCPSFFILSYIFLQMTVKSYLSQNLILEEVSQKDFFSNASGLHFPLSRQMQFYHWNSTTTRVLNDTQQQMWFIHTVSDLNCKEPKVTKYPHQVEVLCKLKFYIFIKNTHTRGQAV